MLASKRRGHAMAVSVNFGGCFKASWGSFKGVSGSYRVDVRQVWS